MESMTRMRRAHVRVGLTVLCAAALAACGDGISPTAIGDARVEAFVDLMNEHRVDVGCDPLQWSPNVADVAQAHSSDMVERGFFSHTNPDGESPFQRLANAGIEYSLAAENIAYGYPDAQAVLEGWLGSPGHRANIENCALTHHGVGLVDSYWTHLFVTP
jgi:uncharacterized protein YkwD